jgi:1-acyl-sn-glycerol-3-phosphate acyltransferase
MRVPELSAVIPQRDNKLAKWVGLKVLSLLGWKIVGNFPARTKFVVAIAPHTSNWDFIIAVAAMLALQIKIRFLAKDALFFWPFKLWLNAIGGIPVDRYSSHGVVEQMVTLFNKQQQLVLAIAPEGTRHKTPQWRSGFLHIAHSAKVPVVPLSLDFAKKEVAVHAPVFITANINDELEKVKKIFENVTPKNLQGI